MARFFTNSHTDEEGNGLKFPGFIPLFFGLWLFSMGVANGQITSLSDGAWENTANWSCSCIPVSSMNQTITVSNLMSINSNIALDQVTVTNTGSITISSTFTVTLDDNFSGPLTINSGGAFINNGSLDESNILFDPVEIFGTFTNAGTINTGGNPDAMHFESGSSYIHNFTSGGTIPTITWLSGSTCEIQNLSNASPTVPSGLNQTFENFTWNTATLGNALNLNGALTTINGNLTFTTTNGKQLRLGTDGVTTAPGYSLLVKQNFNANGGTLTFSGNQTSSTSIQVNGNFSSSTTVAFAQSNANSFELLVKGNFTKSAGNMGIGTGGGSKKVTFNGSGSTQTYSVNAFTSGAIFSVSTGAVVDLGTTPVVTSGTAGSFAVSGTIIVGSTNAAGAISGNIPITSITWNDGSKIIYKNGSNSPQFMGIDQPSTSVPGSAQLSTVIQNTGGVTMINDVTLGGDLTLTSGNLSLGNFALTLNGNFIANSNSLGVTYANPNGSSIVIGGSGTFTGPIKTTAPDIKDFTLNRSSSTISLSADLTVNGTVTLSSGILDFSQSGRTLTLNGSYVRTSGTLTAGSTSTLVIGTPGASVSGGLSMSGTVGTFTLNRTAGISTGSMTVATRLNLTAGTLTATAITVSSGGTIDREDGSLSGSLTTTASNYNLIYSGPNPITTGIEYNGPMNNLTINSTSTVTLSQPIAISGTLTLQSGTFTSGSNDIALSGNLASNGGATNFAGSTLVFNGTTILTGTSNLSLANISVGNGKSLDWGSTIPIVNISGNVDHDNGGTMSPGTGTVQFNGNTTITSNTSNIPRFYNLRIGTGSTLALDCASACGLEGSQYSIEVSGNWDSTPSGSTFTPVVSQSPLGARVVFTGASQDISTQPSHFFFDFYLSGSSSILLTQALNISNDLFIGTGTTLNTGGTNIPVNIGDDFIDNGTFIANSGTVTFNGTSPQNIDQTAGSSTTQFYDVVVTKGGGSFIVNKDVSVANSLNINSAVTYDFDGSAGTDTFTLLSTSGKTAVVLPINAGATLTGTIHAQRYMSGVASIYRYISAPVNLPTVNDLQQEISITGAFTGDSFNGPCTGCAPCTGCSATSTQSMFSYNETLTGTLDSRYANFPVSANTEQLQPGVGYATFVRPSSSITIDLKGAMPKGNITLPTTYSGATANDGWNLVGNPYPSPIDWEAGSWTKTNVDITIYTSSNSSGSLNYATYGTGGFTANGGSRYIASGQGFWVRTLGASPSLIVTEAAKANQQPSFFRTGEPDKTIRMILSKGTATDEVVINFGFAGATDAYDQKIDSYKLNNNTSVDFYTMSSEGKPMTINLMDGQVCGKEIKLGMNHLAAGGYNINFSSINFSDPLNIYINDQFTGKSQLITPSANNYGFQVTSDPASMDPNRLKLVFSAITLDTGIDFTSNDVCAGTDVTVTMASSQLNVGYIAMIGSTVVSSKVIGTNGTIGITIPKDKLAAGINQVQIQASATSCGTLTSLLTKTVPVNVQSYPVINSVTNGTNCAAGQVTIKVGTSSTGVAYNWYETIDAVTPIPGQSAAQLITPFLSATKTYYATAVTSGGCESSRAPVIASIINLDPVSIAEDGAALKSSAASGNQWYIDGTAIAGATNPTLVPVKTGSYKVVVTSAGCSTSSAEKLFVVTGLETPLPDHIRIYPNPTTGQFRVEVASNNPVQASLMSVMGVLVQNEASNTTDKKSFSFNVQDQSDGLYILRIQDGEQTYSTRIIKKK